MVCRGVLNQRTLRRAAIHKDARLATHTACGAEPGATWPGSRCRRGPGHSHRGGRHTRWDPGSRRCKATGGDSTLSTPGICDGVPRVKQPQQPGDAATHMLPAGHLLSRAHRTGAGGPARLGPGPGCARQELHGGRVGSAQPVMVEWGPAQGGRAAAPAPAPRRRRRYGQEAAPASGSCRTRPRAPRQRYLAGACAVAPRGR